MVDEAMKISPKYTVGDWQALKFSTEDEWQTGISIFDDRYRGRFLKPISMIANCEFSGFATLALDCLLAETLQQFIDGLEQTPDGKAKEYFVKFLTKTSFGEWFDEEKAKMFYDQIRCGILHQAETKKSSKVRIRGPLVKPSEDGEGLIINRKLFHRQLVEEFESYKEKLRNPSEETLRNSFIKKMNYICRIPQVE
jgi:hypothetical protein